MRLLRSFPILAFALVFLSIVGLSMAQQSPGLLLVAGALAAISWSVTEGPRGRSLPKWVSNVLVLAIALWSVADFLSHSSGDYIHEVIGRFGLWLTVIKLYERRTARDYAHLLMLSFLLMLIASLHTADLIFGLVLLAYIVLGIYVLLLYQLHAAYERARRRRLASPPGASQETQPAEATPFELLPAMKPIVGQRLTYHFRSLVTCIGVAGFLLGLVVFLAFPRGVGEDLFGRGIVAGHRTGMSDSVHLIHGTRITESRRPVMSVQILDQQGSPFEYHLPLRLRGYAHDSYDGNGRWDSSQQTRQARQRHEVTASDFRAIAPVPLEPQRTFTQVVRSYIDRDVLFALSTPVAVSADRTGVVEYDDRKQLLTIPASELPPANYQIRFQPFPRQDVTDALIADLPIGGLDGLLKLHDEDIHELALEQMEKSGVDLVRPRIEDDPEGYWRWGADAARTLTRYLQSEEFAYTLDLDFALPSINGRAVDPVYGFLFHAKRGHCEYFASALVALCTNLGIESRLIAGYLVSDFDDGASAYEVLERNAHAWVEVRTGRRQWSVFDPTPAAALREILEQPPTFGDRLRTLYDRAAIVWSRSVIDFDWRSQQRLADRLDGGIAGRITDAVNAVRRWISTFNVAFHFGRGGYMYIAFVLGVLTFAIFVLVKLLRRTAAVRRAVKLQHHQREYQRLLRDARFYVDMLELLERGGFPKPTWLPPVQFAHSIATTNPHAAEMSLELTQRFYRSRYGGEPLAAAEVRTVREKLEQLAQALHVHRRAQHFHHGGPRRATEQST